MNLATSPAGCPGWPGGGSASAVPPMHALLLLTLRRCFLRLHSA